VRTEWVDEVSSTSWMPWIAFGSRAERESNKPSCGRTKNVFSSRSRAPVGHGRIERCKVQGRRDRPIRQASRTPRKPPSTGVEDASVSSSRKACSVITPACSLRGIEAEGHRGGHLVAGGSQLHQAPHQVRGVEVLTCSKREEAGRQHTLLCWATARQFLYNPHHDVGTGGRLFQAFNRRWTGPTFRRW